MARLATVDRAMFYTKIYRGIKMDDWLHDWKFLATIGSQCFFFGTICATQLYQGAKVEDLKRIVCNGLSQKVSEIHGKVQSIEARCDERARRFRKDD